MSLIKSRYQGSGWKGSPAVCSNKSHRPKQLTEDEARNTARRAYEGNTRLSSADKGKAIGRARRTVDAYIADLRAVNQMDLDIKKFRLNRLGIPQDRIAKRLGGRSKNYSLPFRENGSIAKFPKWRFVLGIYSCTGG